MKKVLTQLGLFFLLTWALLYAFEYFDINVKEFNHTAGRNEKIQEAGNGLEGIRNESLPENEDFEGTELDIVGLVNQARKDHGLVELRRNEKLTQSAMLKARDMKEKEYFEHISPEGLQPWFFVEQAGYKYKTVGENLAEGYFSAQEVHEAWMNSRGHRENVLSIDFEEIGVAVLAIEKKGKKSFVSVQHFGTELEMQEIQAETRTIVVCEEKVKKDCIFAQEKRDEINDTIKKQEATIKKAQKEGFSEKELQDLYENLEKMEEIKKEIKEYLEKCKKYIKDCDSWR